MKENKEAGISQNDSRRAERPERKKRTSVKETKKEKTSKLKIIPLGGLEQIGMNITAFEYRLILILQLLYLKTRLHQNGYVTQKPDKQLKPDHKVSDEQPVLSAQIGRAHVELQSH